MVALPVFAQSEAFKKGWVAGFYDAYSDDGCRYIAEVVTPAASDPEFLAGYRLGREFRRGTLSPVGFPHYSPPAMAA